MRSLRTAAAAVLVCLSLCLAGAHPARADDAPLGQREIEEMLTCQCGCGLTVATCNHLECSFAVPVRKEIAESLARGETGAQIIERYKKEYGEKVLSSPIPEGFNLLAWIGPYLAIVVAGVAMFSFFRRRARRVEPVVEAALPSAPADDERRARLRQEVEDLER
jgi:cytochrome c-type biogenesis protein CcmH